MSLLAPMRSWWRALMNRSQIDRDVEDELQFHVDAHTEHLMGSGLSREAAARQARIEFGRVDVQKEKYRAAIGLQPLHEIGGDFRQGVRSLWRHSFVATAAIVSLALGIGATSAMFNVIYSALLHPFPYADADRIVNPSLINLQQPLVPTWFLLEPAQFASFLHAKSIDSVLGFRLGSQPETGGEFPEDVQVAFVTPNMGSFLGVPTLYGRTLQPSDDGQDVIVLSYKYWQRRYGGDPSVIGRKLELNRQNLTIVGVMPQRFAFTETVGNVDGYIPWTVARTFALFPWIKLKPGVTPNEADGEFQAYLNQFKQQTPKHFPKDFRMDVQPIAAPYIHRTGRTLGLLFASVVSLLLIGCVNCSVLLLARGEARQQDLLIRSAIGASRYRLIRQLLVESFLIAFAGAGFGMLLSLWLAKLPLKLMPGVFPQEAVIAMNWPVLGFSVLLAVITGMLFGLAPALRFSRPDLAHVIQKRSRTLSSAGGRSLNLLIGVQIALTFVLLGVAGEAIMGFVQTTSMKLGYDPHHVGFITVPLKADPTKNQPAYAGYIARLRDAMAAIPGVVSVGILSSGIPPSQPLGSAEALPPFEVFGTPRDEQQKALVQLVSPEYFATLKTPLLRGRLWSQDENRLGDSVAVVNDTFAKRYLGERDAIGQQLRTDAVKDDGAPLSITSPHSNQWRQVVGVVADSQNVGLERSVAPTIYLPYTTFMWNTTQFFLRTAGDPQSMEHSLRTAVHTFNPEQRIAGNKIGTLDEVLSTQNLWVQQRILSVLFSFFGGLALCLCLLGITSTVLFAARRRKSELGIRMALGASPRHIVWAVSSQTLFAIAGGLAAGMLCNMALRKLVEHWMPGGHDAPWIALPVAAMLAIGAAIASLMPAVRASHADPMEALRSD